ncbi:uncharacterized protein LOC114297094 [Camellia sinensis]|uniref:uncharacterized protein LOC114297094 n=1 Tax=Camellia sinensis TaxID=4442 RepID=UPI00103640CE|nr:uncharacterized protein LOC114297094 [Camellia sinensis]
MNNLSKAISNGDFDESSSSDDDVIMMQLFTTQHQRFQMLSLNQQTRHVGSISGHRYINRDRVKGDEQIYRDYFADNPVYPEEYFRRRFRMRQSLFVSILHDIQQVNEYFIQTRDGIGAPGLSGVQKMIAALRILQYDVPADVVDEYIRIRESTAIAALNFFTRSIVATYEAVYLRSPNEADVARLLQDGEQRGFPGMLGSLDCMHWRWDKCLSAHAGAYTRHYHKPTVVLEAVASYDLWIWHAFFGMPGSLNDITVLDRSPLFTELTRERAPATNYTINNHAYTMGYYLADGIYPHWATIVKTISQPQGAKRQLFARMQEACRKDVERAFGVLQAQFNIVSVPARDFLPIGLLPLVETLPSPTVGLLPTLGLLSSSKEMQFSIGDQGLNYGFRTGLILLFSTEFGAKFLLIFADLASLASAISLAKFENTYGICHLLQVK